MPAWLTPSLVWFLVGLALVVGEFLAPGLVIIFFGIGAWLAAATSALGLTPGLTGQLAVAVVGSLATLFCLRGWLKGMFRGHVPQTQDPNEPMDDFIGGEAVVMTDIRPGSLDGQVMFRGSVWKARAEEEIAKDEPVEIVKRESLVLHVARASGQAAAAAAAAEEEEEEGGVE